MKIDVDHLNFYYGPKRALHDITLRMRANQVTAFIGPSGCGKSTVLRCLNRMNDLVRGFRFEGQVCFRGKDIYAPSIDPVAVRRYVGMVFQQPNPFAMSIYRNVSFGLRLNGYRGNVKETAFSGAFDLREALERRNARPLATDPLYDEAELRGLGFEPWDGGEVAGAILQADHAAYAGLAPADLPGVRAVVDGRGMLDPVRFTSAGVALRRIGGG